MGIELVLNDLSLEPLAENKDSARQRLWQFKKTVSAAVNMRANRFVRCPENIHRRFLTSGYSLGDWLRDDSEDRELRSYLRSMFTKSPYWQDDQGLEEKIISRLFEFNVSDSVNQESVGLGVAALLSGLSVSFSSAEIWKQTFLNVRILTEIQTTDGEFSTSDEIAPVYHISHPNHLADHQDWIEQRLAIMPENGQVLWDNRKVWFPKLDFCANTESQITSLTSEKLSPVTEHLINLQRYCEGWIDGNFNDNQFPPKRISTESQATLQQYGQERTFSCPDGQTRTFSWHLKFNPDTWRIHFFPLPETKRIMIGYVGRHLPTVRFNH